MKLFCAVVFAALFLLIPSTAFAILVQEDIKPPVLVGVTFQPATIDTSSSPQTITVTVHVTDDLSGLYDVAMYFHKERTTQDALVEFRPYDGIGGISAGNAQDGKFYSTITLPRYSAYGKWEMFELNLIDNVGNIADIMKPPVGQPEDPNWRPAYDTVAFWNGPEQQKYDLFIPSVTR